ncbi:syntaxin-like [Varroa jacobsoni]|uniref:t-SNARE coiled-coil homology domain-containing protein n=1 Tax=Varroa destructor TaxID=109461 RepID=A0A7M7MAB9_VARDE|nr:syntaxin-like [Varroa destructor]XP_022705195.1 syntaxin-like [Varroa jacobsoni]
MPRDLLAELQSRAAPVNEEDENKKSAEVEETVTIEIENNNQVMVDQLGDFRKKAQQVQDDLDRMRERTDHVKDIHAEILSSPDGGDRNNELEDVMAEVKRLASRIQGALKMIKQKAEEAINENPTSAVSRMKLIQQQTLSKTFVDIMMDYNHAQMEYRERCKDRIKRQLFITGQSTTDEKLEEIIESGNVDVFTQGTIMKTAKAKEALADVQARHKDILQLEKSIRELRDMFLEMAVLVEGQGEMVNRIEYNVANARDFVEQAKKETAQAVEYQKAALKKKFWLIAIGLSILLIIIIIIFVGEKVS